MKRFLLALLLVPSISFAQLPVETDDNIAILKGEMFSAEYSTTGLASAATYLVGITTGSRQVMILDRSYTSSESSLRVQLYEVTFSGGSDITRFNRNLIVGGTGPLTIKAGVTATLGTPITTATFISTSSANNIQLAIASDAQRFMLKPNTSYVVALTNTGAAAANIGSRFNFRGM